MEKKNQNMGTLRGTRRGEEVSRVSRFGGLSPPSPGSKEQEEETQMKDEKNTSHKRR